MEYTVVKVTAPVEEGLKTAIAKNKGKEIISIVPIIRFAETTGAVVVFGEQPQKKLKKSAYDVLDDGKYRNKVDKLQEVKAVYAEEEKECQN